MATDMTHTEDNSLRQWNAEDFPGHRVVLGREKPLRLDCGVELHEFTIAYQTYGTLNKDRSKRHPYLSRPDRRSVRRRRPTR